MNIFSRRWFLKSAATVPLALGHIRITLTKESEKPLEIPKVYDEVKLLEPGWYNVRVADIKLGERKDGSPIIKMVLEEEKTKAIISQYISPKYPTLALAFLQRFEPFENLISKDSLLLDEFRDRKGRIWVEVETYENRKFHRVNVLRKENV